MVIGRGMIASYFNEYILDENIIIFASGVSDSTENDQDHFRREEDLLRKMLQKYKSKTFVYFSSCNIDSPEANGIQYYSHKKRMEEIIESISKNFLIFRLPNVLGDGGNKKNFINFIFEKIENGKPIDIWIKSTRNIIDIEDVVKVVNYIVKNNIVKNKVINIAYDDNTPILDVVKTIEDITGKKAKIRLINKGDDFKIDNSISRQIMSLLGLRQKELRSLIIKYKVDK